MTPRPSTNVDYFFNLLLPLGLIQNTLHMSCKYVPLLNEQVKFRHAMCSYVHALLHECADYSGKHFNLLTLL